MSYEVSIIYLVRTHTHISLCLCLCLSLALSLSLSFPWLCPGTPFVDQAGLELSVLPVGNKGVCHQTKPGNWRGGLMVKRTSLLLQRIQVLFQQKSSSKTLVSSSKESHTLFHGYRQTHTHTFFFFHFKAQLDKVLALWENAVLRILNVDKKGIV